MYQKALTETKRVTIIKNIETKRAKKGGDNLKNDLLIMLRGKKTRAEVARDLGITPQGLGMIERGVRIPRPELMSKIAVYYSKTVDEIFFANCRHKKCQQIPQNKTCAATVEPEPKPAA